MQNTSRNTVAVSFRAATAITALTLGVALTCSANSSFAALNGGFPQPSGWPQIKSSQVSSEEIGPGVRFERWLLWTDAGPLVVSLATVDLHNPAVALAVATHNGVIIGRGERLTSMADRLGAELGINADYFDISESGSPLNLVLVNRRVLHQSDLSATFVMNGRDQIVMGPVSWRMHVTSAAGATLDVTRLNEWAPSVDLAVLTPELGSTAGGGATEMVLVPEGEAGHYRVARIDTNLATLEPLEAGQFGVTARGSQAQALVHDFHPNDAVSVTEVSDPPLSGARLGVGGGPLLLQDGQPVADPAPPAPEETNVRNPVSGAGLSADGATLWLVVVDGRRPALSIGLTRPQLAALFVALGARTAMAFDSGGSSEMVIRHPGDLTSSVATTPSDGRERSIADGLFVLNTAPEGPISTLLLKAERDQVLAGSTLAISVRAMDANQQPIEVRPSDVAFSASPASLASIDRSGLLRAYGPGSVEVSAEIRGVQARSMIRVCSSVAMLSIVPAEPSVPVRERLKLGTVASSADGQPIAVDEAAVRWSWQGAGQVLPDGAFVAGPRPARTIVTANAGGASSSVVVLSGDHAVMIQALPKAGAARGLWQYAALPVGLPGGVDNSAAPDGSPALRLAYDFSNAEATRAAYAQTELILPGHPIALAVDVFGDGDGEWLRGGYRNADGNLESLTIARHVDWHGWRTIRVAIPTQAAWPIVWTRLYAVESSKDAREQGSLWFRNFKLFYPGP